MVILIFNSRSKQLIFTGCFNNLIITTATLLTNTTFVHKSGNVFISGYWHRIYNSFDCHQWCSGIWKLDSIFKHLHHWIRSPLLKILMYHSICQQLTDSDFWKTDNRFSRSFHNDFFLRNNCHNILHDFFMWKCITWTKFLFSYSIQSGIFLVPNNSNRSPMQRFEFFQIFCNHQSTHIRDIPCPGIIFHNKFFMLQVF